MFVLTTSIASSKFIFTTIPNTDSGLAYVFAEEGTLNVSLYCEVIQNNFQIQTSWFVKRQNDSVERPTDYNATGELTTPSDLVGKITATGDVIPGNMESLTYETNFTILKFTSEFNLAQVQCGSGTIRVFNLGFPGIVLISFSPCLPVPAYFSSPISINSC